LLNPNLTWSTFVRLDGILSTIDIETTEACHMRKGYKGRVLTSLETRRLQADLIEVFKIFKGFDNIKYTQYFTMSDTGLKEVTN